jgi:hypothetical protein
MANLFQDPVRPLKLSSAFTAKLRYERFGRTATGFEAPRTWRMRALTASRSSVPGTFVEHHLQHSSHSQKRHIAGSRANLADRLSSSTPSGPCNEIQTWTQVIQDDSMIMGAILVMLVTHFGAVRSPCSSFERHVRPLCKRLSAFAMQICSSRTIMHLLLH